MASVLATKYARALLDLLAQAPEAELEDTVRQVRAFRDVYTSSHELQSALLSPAVNIATRRKVIGALVERLGLNDLVRRFLYVVCDHGRTPLLDEIVDSVEEQIDARLGRATADVSVATDLAEEQRATIRARLAALTGKEVRARFTQDESLIGGFRAQIGSTVYDASVKGQFDALRHRMGEVS